MQFTTYYSLGVAVEILQGKLEGSKAYVYFTPKEETTAVTVVGDFKSFNEENAYLKKCLRHVICKGQEEQENILI